jgi:uncharacterized repeat protein (TIGR01451 family)
MRTTFTSLLFVIVFSIASYGQALVTNTANSGTGSLRQAIAIANSDPSIQEIIFNIPTTDIGYNATTGVFTIEVTGSALPNISRAGLTIDGNTQTNFTGNSNTALLGGAEVGIDGIEIPALDAPEIYIKNTVGSLTRGFNVTAANVTIKNVAISGFGTGFSHNHGNIVISNASGATIESVVLGSKAHVLEIDESAASNNGNNIYVRTSQDVTVRNSVIAFAGAMGIYYTGNSPNSNTEYNYFYQNARLSTNCDAIDYIDSTTGGVAFANFIHQTGGCGIDTWQSAGGITMTNNTITENGIREEETPGIRVWGVGSTITKNIIHSNYGSGVLVQSTSTGNTISENSFKNNGNILSAFGSPQTNAIAIDLMYAWEDHKKGTTPFFTLNDLNDVDNGGNGALNFPVIESVKLENGQLTLRGWSRPDAKIEFYVADLFSGAIFPQGEDFLFSAIEGSNDDNDIATSSYGPESVNGLEQGTDNTNRFEFTFSAPSNVSEGTLITSTATLNSNTSEFGGAAPVELPLVLQQVRPVLECIYKSADDNFVGVFGYLNPNQVEVEIPVGSTNRFNPNPQDRGQTTNFLPGRQVAVFEVPYASGNQVWILNGRTSTAGTNPRGCKVDLGVTKQVNNALPEENEEVTFTITLTNNSDFPTRNVVVNDKLNENSFTYVSSNASAGSYNEVTGDWEISFFEANASATLEITATVLNSGDNVVTIVSQEQHDINPNNDEAIVSVSVEPTSGGNDGGIESHGNMASKLAQRAYKKMVTNKVQYYENPRNLPQFEGKNLDNASRNETSSLASYLPTVGPLNTDGFVSSPSDLIYVTNANEVIGVDFYNAEDKRIAAILATNSEMGEVYDHTKVICDRLNGASLEDVRHVSINDKWFILAKLLHPNGNIDYNISFSAFKWPNQTFTVDARWNNENYSPNPQDSIFNFQVWANTPQFAVEITENILENIENTSFTRYNNAFKPTIPYTFVKSGTYQNGDLLLEMANPANASMIVAFGSKAEVENGERTGINAEVPVSEGSVTFNQGHIFDIGFSFYNNTTGGLDVVYFADGPWGLEYAEEGFIRDEFTVEPFNLSSQVTGARHLERNPFVSGDLRDELILFRTLKTGGHPVDLSGFTGIKFEGIANEERQVEVVISTTDIYQWEEQYYTTLTFNTSLNAYEVAFENLTSTGNTAFDPSQITAVSFRTFGDGVGFSPFDLSINNLRFEQFTPVSVNEVYSFKNEFSIFPNPFNNDATIALNIKTQDRVKVELFDISGKSIANLFEGNLGAGEQIINLNGANLKAGIYLVRITANGTQKTERIIKH